ncbi:hypothetical protein [uncultured Aquimarina sp.]|uniref:hypothetical protein n=1 Tax=uncultured Aquimarina sp. TaxID=575652 RepID=UPI002614E854|nr:hypothetical protein [uncultured Aquimarina sp.]
MIKIKLKPSFHKFSSILLNGNDIEYEIHPRLKDLNGLDKKDKLTTAEYLELKKLKSFNEEAEKERYLEKNKILDSNISEKLQIEELITQIYEKPQIDERIILDGIGIECSLNKSDLESKIIEFHSPDTKTREFEIINNLFSILNNSFKHGPVLNHIELIQGYFGIGKQWKITNKNPLTIRLFGSLSIHEKEGLIDFFQTLNSNEFLILDIRNLDGMGSTFHECFKKLIDRMKVVYWLVQNKENELLNRHLNEMEISRSLILTDINEIFKKIKEHNTI